MTKLLRIYINVTCKVYEYLQKGTLAFSGPWETMARKQIEWG